MVKPASLSRSALSLTCLALILGGTVVSAQQARPADDSRTESEEAIFIPIEYRPPPWQVSVGVRLSGKAKVKFSGLGSIPNTSTYGGPDPKTEDKTTDEYKTNYAYIQTYGRQYADGNVYADATYALNSAGTGNERVTPTDGRTNYWGFTSTDQLVTHDGVASLAMHNYAVTSANSADATKEADNGKSLGLDIEISRELGASKRMSWGLTFGFGVNDLNCKTSNTINAKLYTSTDYYSLEGLTIPSGTLGYSGNVESYYTTTVRNAAGYYETVYVYDPSGNRVKVWSSPNAQRLPTDPFDRVDTTADDASIVVDGYWQMKGAYATLRLGPYFAFQLTRRLALRASAGVTFTVMGAKFILNERAYIPALEDYLQLSNEKVNMDPVVTGKLGYFVSGELDAFLTDRTGVFLGVSRENYGRDLSISYYLQKAEVSLNTGTILRTGVTTRF